MKWRRDELDYEGIRKKQAPLISGQGLAQKLAVREGFEPSMPFDIHAFQACSFDHSDTSPGIDTMSTKAEGAYLSPARSLIQGATAGLTEVPARLQIGV